MVDTSGSMKALDFKIEGENTDRLSVVKQVLKKFVQKRQGDRISVISFGDYPVTLSPLTLDTSSLEDTVDEMEIGMAGESTAIGSALGLAIKRVKDIKAEDKIIILMTDGRSNSGDVSPLQMAGVAKELGIKIYTIGIGASDGKAPFLVNGFFGKRVVYQNLDLDDKTLIEISESTSGKYFNALDSDSLSGIYDDIDKLEKRESEMFSHVEYKDYYPQLILFLLFLLMMELLLRITFDKSFPLGCCMNLVREIHLFITVGITAFVSVVLVCKYFQWQKMISYFGGKQRKKNISSRINFSIYFFFSDDPCLSWALILHMIFKKK